MIRAVALIGEAGQVGGKSFIEPDVSPGATGDLVPKPLMSHFMGDEAKAKTTHKAHGLMLHTSSPAKLSMSIFFVCERIGAKQFIVQGHNVESTFSLGLALAQGFRIHIIKDFDRVSIVKGEIVTISGIVSHREGYQVRCDRMTVLPMVDELSIVLSDIHKHAVACCQLTGRGRDEYIQGIDFIYQILLPWPPISDAVRFGERPDDRVIIVCALFKRTEAIGRRYTFIGDG